MADDRNEKVDVDVSSGAGWAFVALLVIVLVRGEPDLLDVLQEFCRRYMVQGAPTLPKGGA